MTSTLFYSLAAKGVNLALAMKGRDRCIIKPPPVRFDAMTADEIRAYAIDRGLCVPQNYKERIWGDEPEAETIKAMYMSRKRSEVMTKRMNANAARRKRGAM